METKKFKISIELEVTQNWVEDGFELDQERLEQIQILLEENLLPYAIAGIEVKANIKAKKK